MLSVVIPTEGDERAAVATLTALVPGAAAGVVSDVILVDRPGSSEIERVADVAGCRFMAFAGPRAAAMAAGAAQTKSEWLLFLQAGAIPDSGWIDESAQFIKVVSDAGRPRAGIFRYAPSPYAETGWRDSLRALTRLMSGPRGDEGVLIARRHYDQLGGYAAAGSETGLLRRLGRSARAELRSRLVRL
ncbi:MAG: glycosyl transferase [Rhodopseudomonas palustris]|nr:MAG: glycosyl transferase [Rhodopseudomonas palustris]